MSSKDKKLWLIEQLIKTENRSVLDKIEQLIKDAIISDYENLLKPMSSAQFKKRISYSEKDIVTNNLVAQEDVVKYFRAKKKKS
jgi:hypothetical protein